MRVQRFFESVYWDNRMRSAGAVRHLGKDLFLYARGRALTPVELLLRRRYGGTSQPIVFIVGVPRSGTTLLSQLLSDYLDVAFVNNRMAAYWITPILGAVLHGKAGGGHGIELASQRGRARGDLAPHEFGWFWHYYGDFRRHDHLTDGELEAIDWRPIRRSLEGIAARFERPLVLKSVNYVNYHIAFLKRVFPSAKFVWIRRHPAYAAQSILKVRVQEYGDANEWWSVRTRDVDDWRDRPAVEQVVHQVRDLTRAIGAGMEALPAGDGLEVAYEELSAEPFEQVSAIARCIGARVSDVSSLRELRLEARNSRTAKASVWESIEAALARPPV